MRKIVESLKLHTFLKDGAVFVADSHYSKQNRDLYKLLLKFQKNPPPQLFLVGDIFQLLLNFPYLKTYNNEIIELINQLSESTEIFYFEGNHDFCLKGVFNSKIKILMELKKDGICINHGDIYIEDKIYKFYSKIVRKKIMLSVFNIISFNFINNWVFKKILNKKIRCHKIGEFKKLAKYKIKQYKNCNLIIEGHYHQNKKYKNYLNLPSLYCQKSYLEFQKSEFIEKYL